MHGAYRYCTVPSLIVRRVAPDDCPTFDGCTEAVSCHNDHSNVRRFYHSGASSARQGAMGSVLLCPLRRYEARSEDAIF